MMDEPPPSKPPASSDPTRLSPDVPSRHHNFSDWITQGAERHPNKRAWADDRLEFSYSEAEARIQRMAAWLQGKGVGSGDCLAIWLGNQVETLEALFACARIGGIALPINARLTPTEVAFQLADSETRLVLIQPNAEESAIEALRQIQTEEPIVVSVDERLEKSLAATTPTELCAQVVPEDPAILMYTSGTTGQPKGALLPHRKALYNSLNAKRYFDIRPDDHVLVVAPLFHSLGLQILSLPILFAGASLRIQDGFHAERVWTTIETEGISYFGGVPTMHQRLLEALDEGRPYNAPPACLRFAFTAGAAASKELIRSFHAYGLQLKQGYGQTETSILTCLQPEHALDKAGSVGRPVQHAEIRLVDPASIEKAVSEWHDVAVGEIGEVVVRGPITMLGYWRRPDATAETIREGWLRTGDLATRDEDFDITLVGRSREMFISGGENVYPAEVEACLEEHPSILEAAVVALPDPKWGESGQAHVVVRNGMTFDPASIERWLESRLARFKRPRQIVVEDSLPRTASGKIQKHRLRG